MEPMDEVLGLLRNVNGMLVNMLANNPSILTIPEALEVHKIIAKISGFELGYNTAHIVHQADEHSICDYKDSYKDA